jgi:hypothetical protein
MYAVIALVVFPILDIAFIKNSANNLGIKIDIKKMLIKKDEPIAVETNVYGVVITAVLFVTPQASIANIIPLVLELTAKLITGFVFNDNSLRFFVVSILFIKAEKLFSNSKAFFPVVSQPESRISKTACFSSSEIEGRAKGTVNDVASDIK